MGEVDWLRRRSKLVLNVGRLGCVHSEKPEGNRADQVSPLGTVIGHPISAGRRRVVFAVYSFSNPDEASMNIRLGHPRPGWSYIYH
jgi:hypothetical protein